MEQIHTLVIFTTSRCTLNCKLCSAGIPIYHKGGIEIDTDPASIIRGVSAFFEKYKVERIDISGGEPLIWGENKLIELLEKLSLFRKSYREIRIITNGTVLPSSKLTDAIKRLGGIGYVVDNYGDLSPKAESLMKILNQSSIRYQENKYNGEDQWCGGWTDILGNLSYKNHDAQKLKKIYESCHVHKELRFLVGDKIYPCSTAPLVEKLSICTLKNPTSACQYCNGFDSDNCVRYPAAEQI